MTESSSLVLTSDDREKLLGFLGYGRLEARFWFLGMEEGSGGSDNVEPNIKIRLKFSDTLMDLHEAHDKVYLNWEYWDTSVRVRFPSVWVYMARLVRALSDNNTEDWWDTAKAKAYIREHLGRNHESGQTFLTEILPLPKRRATDWPPLYKNAFNFKERQDYERDILPRRKERINHCSLNINLNTYFVMGKPTITIIENSSMLTGEFYRIRRLKLPHLVQLQLF